MFKSSPLNFSITASNSSQMFVLTTAEGWIPGDESYTWAYIFERSNQERLLRQSSTSILRQPRHFLGNNEAFIW